MDVVSFLLNGADLFSSQSLIFVMAIFAIIEIVLLVNKYGADRAKNWKTDFMIIIGTDVLDRLGMAGIMVGNLLLVQSLFGLETLEQRQWYHYIGYFFVFEFLYYWKHRFEHEYRGLWSYHCVHHSSDELNFSTSFRMPWFGPFFTWIFFSPALAFGASPVECLVAYRLIILYQVWTHSTWIPKLWGPLEFVFNTASHHRVHHCKNEGLVDKNYGGVLIIWDRLFGTFAEEKSEVSLDYGVSNQMPSDDAITVNIYEPYLFVQDLIRAKSLTDFFQILFSKTAKRASQPAYPMVFSISSVFVVFLTFYSLSAVLQMLN